jgi:CHAT domain-containing protein
MAFRNVLDNPGKDAIPAARALYDVLWRPIASDITRLGAVNVMLSLDGPVRYIPMGALHDGKDWLAARYNLSLFMPAALGKITQRPNPVWNVFTAGVSKSRRVDDGFGTQVDFSPLPGVSRELSRIGSVMRTGSATCLDDSFTLDAFKLGLLSQPRVVHLASHFQFNPGSESKSFLLTGKGDVLRVSDTRVLTPVAFRSVELLTLSACKTGMSTEKADGSEVEGISGILQRKGAAAVLSTLWPVADESTEAFMSSFYALRAKSPGVSKVQCLRQIQVAMMQGQLAPGKANVTVIRKAATRSTAKVTIQSSQRSWSHPYYWAPFILQGNWM